MHPTYQAKCIHVYTHLPVEGYSTLYTLLYTLPIFFVYTSPVRLTRTYLFRLLRFRQCSQESSLSMVYIRSMLQVMMLAQRTIVCSDQYPDIPFAVRLTNVVWIRILCKRVLLGVRNTFVPCHRTKLSET